MTTCLFSPLAGAISFRYMFILQTKVCPQQRCSWCHSDRSVWDHHFCIRSRFISRKSKGEKVEGKIWLFIFIKITQTGDTDTSVVVFVVIQVAEPRLFFTDDGRQGCQVHVWLNSVVITLLTVDLMLQFIVWWSVLAVVRCSF